MLSAGETGLDDFGGRPGPLFAVAGFAVVALIVVARGAAGFRVVVVLVAVFLAASAASSFAFFSLSRASYSSFGGSLSVIRLSPEVRESMSSFSLPFEAAGLIA